MLIVKHCCAVTTFTYVLDGCLVLIVTITGSNSAYCKTYLINCCSKVIVSIAYKYHHIKCEAIACAINMNRFLSAITSYIITVIIKGYRVRSISTMSFALEKICGDARSVSEDRSIQSTIVFPCSLIVQSVLRMCLESNPTKYWILFALWLAIASDDLGYRKTVAVKEIWFSLFRPKKRSETHNYGWCTSLPHDVICDRHMGKWNLLKIPHYITYTHSTFYSILKSKSILCKK